MASSVLWFMYYFCFLVVFVFGQDTFLQDTLSHKAGKYGSSDELMSNLNKMEERLDHKVRETERRVMRRLNDKLHVQTQSQTQALAHLETAVETLGAQVEESGTNHEGQEETIKHLRQQVTRQQHELHRMSNNVERLRKTVTNLSTLVEKLLTGDKEEDPGTQALPTPIPGTQASTKSPFRPIFAQECQEVYQNGGMKYPGFYYIMIQPYLSPKPFEVCCKMTNNSGWTLIQRRMDGSVEFYKTWDEYKNGFGNIEGEFWLGNDHIYQLTNQGDVKLRIEFEDWDGQTYWAEYDHFRIEDEGKKYRLHVHGYHGNAGDSLTSRWESHNNQPFSTKDHDNDNRFYDNCAEHYHGAWWFRSCFQSHLNGVFYHKGAHNNYFVRNGIQWNTIHMHSSLKQVAMMIKPNPDVVESSGSNGIK